MARKVTRAMKFAKIEISEYSKESNSIEKSIVDVRYVNDTQLERELKKKHKFMVDFNVLEVYVVNLYMNESDFIENAKIK